MTQNLFKGGKSNGKEQTENPEKAGEAGAGSIIMYGRSANIF